MITTLILDFALTFKVSFSDISPVFLQTLTGGDGDISSFKTMFNKYTKLILGIALIFGIVTAFYQGISTRDWTKAIITGIAVIVGVFLIALLITYGVSKINSMTLLQ